MKAIYKEKSLKSGIYQIRNVVDGKVYIGSCKEFKSRYNGHLNSLRKNKHHNKHLQNAFNQYGEDKFVFEVLEIVDGDRLNRTTREQEYLNLYSGDWKTCYNIERKSIKEDNKVFSKSPEETSKRRSEARKRFLEDNENIKRISEMFREKWKDPEYREKMLLSLKRINESKTGVPRTEECIKNMSEATKKLWEDTSYKGNSKCVSFINVNDGSKKYFGSIKEASYFFNVHWKTLSRAIKNNRKIKKTYLLIGKEKI